MSHNQSPRSINSATDMSPRPIPIDSSAAHSLRDAVRAMLTKAAKLGSRDGDQSVHSSRRQMKRIRAALRLLRAAIGDSSYRAFNREVRDAARPLTPLRDAAVLLRSLELLPRLNDVAGCRAYANQARRLLRAELASNRRKLTNGALRRCAASLHTINRRMETLPAGARALKSARRGMKRTYSQGRAAFGAALRRPTPDTLHEWRKQVKYLSNQASLVRSLFGAKLQKIRRRSRELETLLGQDHDLVLLELKLDELHGKGLLAADDAVRGVFKGRINRRREKLQAASYGLGKRLYRRSPGKFVRLHLP
jgi:CHAD domain-containing protein